MSGCAPSRSALPLEVLPPTLRRVNDTLIFARCSKRAQLHATCASLPRSLLHGRKNRCNFQLAASQLLGERLEVSGGKERAAQGSPDFTKCSFRIVSRNNLDISKNSSSWGILWHSCVGEINLEIPINATIELLTTSPL